MSRKTNRRSRGGYTLIELLVVMAIIGILVGITIPAVQKIREYGPRTQCINDIRQFEQGLEGFKSTYHAKYVPSAFVACADYDSAPAASGVTINNKADSKRYYKSIWNRSYTTYNLVTPANPPYGTGLDTPTTQNDQPLDGSQCLIFFLMGPKKLGFNDQPQPYSLPATQGKLFIDWPAGRLDSTGTRPLDPWGQPYVYFSAKEGNDYQYFGPLYYGNTTGGYTPAGMSTMVHPLKDPNGKHLNSSTYQILSAGKDGKKTGFGSGGIRTAGQGEYAQGAAGGDDLSNVQGRVLSAAD